MAYLSNQNNEIIIDAVLTKYGREKLAAQGNLGITKFALSDDEVDYSLYNVDHPMGTDFYDVAIVKMPTLEALPGNSLSMKYKLFTNRDTTSLSNVSKLGVSEVEPLVVSQAGVYYSFTPYIIPAAADPTKVFYIAEMNNINKVDMLLKPVINSEIGISNDMNSVINEFKAKETATLKYAVGHGFRIIVNTLPTSNTNLVLNLEVGGGYAVSGKKYTIQINAAS